MHQRAFVHFSDWYNKEFKNEYGLKVFAGLDLP